VCADVSGRIANRQVGDQFCKPICKPDAAGQAETGETQKAGDGLAPYVCRGQYGDLRLPETAETHVVWLITQRSRVQIPSPLLVSAAQRPFPSKEGAFCVPGAVVSRVVATGLDAAWPRDGRRGMTRNETAGTGWTLPLEQHERAE
jgi:hypothetical protein